MPPPLRRLACVPGDLLALGGEAVFATSASGDVVRLFSLLIGRYSLAMLLRAHRYYWHDTPRAAVCYIPVVLN
ncbi:hypothetical protein TNCV_3123731 [Trichonephila clavipes]|nr:hypothetical protein TNCV_3123731 [Trichonephila clavipes]